MDTSSSIASQNFARHLQGNPYPGRGLVIGRSDRGESWLIIYWLMGRSTNSRNRRLVAEGNVLRTEAVDPALLEDPSLIIYDAMLELPGIYLVSNGDQTRTIYEALQNGKTFDEALMQREHEPDAPNYTPRISGMLSFKETEASVTLSILKANALDPRYTDRTTFHPSLPVAGRGVGLTTYQGEGNPLPSFTGEPLLLPCAGSAEEVLQTYWSALDANNRIALAVKEISASGTSSRILIRNRSDQE